MDLLTLQANIKTDAEGYEAEFLLQYRHFNAVLEIFRLKPSKDSREFGELATFIAQTGSRYPQHSTGFAAELITLLQTHAEVLDPSLRRTLVQALILLRNRSQVEAVAVLPLFFQLFRCKDKPLRQLLFRHILADVKNANKKHRNERLNRSLQNFMFSVVADDNESAAKRSLTVLTELWRRKIWRDVRTVNVIATAAFHKSPRVMLAVLKFFLGQDDVAEEEAAGGKDDDDDDGAGSRTPVKQPTKEDIYKATKQGTRSSKKKKMNKLKRVMSTLKKATRKANGGDVNTNFMALQLLHDPQSWAERLLARLNRNASDLNWEARLALMQVISRVTGMHKLILLNYYPLLQKYISPHQRDGPAVIAALVQASHDLVPPDVLQPVLKQLVDQFVNDKARPEVMTLGLKACRELCLRCPLVMDATLLQDLALYKKFRNKQVSSAARGLIGLFRELQPELLVKKDRGRGANLAHRPMLYGEVSVAERVDGAELLEAAMLAGQGSEDDEFASGGSGSDSDEQDSDDDDDDEEEEEEDNEGEEEELAAGGTRADDAAAATGEPATAEEPAGSSGGGKAREGAVKSRSRENGAAGEEEGGEEEGGGGAAEASGSGDDSDFDLDSDDSHQEDEGEGGSGSGDDSEDVSGSGSDGEAGSSGRDASPEPRRKQVMPQGDSIASLRKRVALAKAAKAAAASAAAPADSAPSTSTGGGGAPRDPVRERSVTPGVNIELDRILTQEDFKRIANLKQKRLIEAALTKHGMQTVSKAKRRRLVEGAREEAEEAEELADKRAHLGEMRVRPEDLQGRMKRAHDKEARLASVMAGREGRDKFGGAAGMKKKKTGGLSEREKQRAKAMPIAARGQQLKNRKAKNHHKVACPKNFKGRQGR